MEIFEGIKENLPSIDNLGKYTTINIDGSVMMTMIRNVGEKWTEKFEFVPPIFKEYVIRTDDIALIKQEIENECDLRATQAEKEKFVRKRLTELKKAFKNFAIMRYHYYLIRWQTETSFTILYYEAGKKKMYLYVQYKYENNEMAFDTDIEVLSNDLIERFKENSAESDGFAYSMILFVLSVSDYLLNYTNKIEYITDENGQPFRKATRAKARKNQKTNIPDTDRRNIYYKSKIKVYEVSAEEITNYKKKKYRKIKQSWFVRGYYQRYGKEKIPRYIPPRINHRHGVDVSATPKEGNLYEMEVVEET